MCANDGTHALAAMSSSANAYPIAQAIACRRFEGAYVARMASCLQRIRNPKGSDMGIIYGDNGYAVAPYDEILQGIICSEGRIPSDFVPAAGAVSSHGNWFTAESQNREMKAPARPYGWHLFLSDRGLAHFADDVVLSGKCESIKKAFLKSRAKGKARSQFTKTMMDLEARRELELYFSSNSTEAKNWFSAIAPAGGGLDALRSQIDALRTKTGAGAS